MQEKDFPNVTPELLEQNPVLALMFLLVMMVVFVGGVGCLASWIWIFFRLSMGSAVLALTTPWPPRRWSLLDLMVVMGLIISLQAVSVGLVFEITGSQRSDTPALEAIAAGGLASIFGVALGILWLQFRYRVDLTHIGFGPIPWRTLASSLIVGIAFLPVVYFMMILVTALSRTEYEHPLISSAADSGTILSYLLGCFAAVIAAPIAEEFIFRVMLQGWLQSLPFKRLADSLVGTNGNLPSRKGLDRLADSNAANAFNEAEMVSSADDRGPAALEVIPESSQWNPYAPESNFDPLDGQVEWEQAGTLATAMESVQGPDSLPSPLPPIWPSILAGVLFGLAHYEYGLSFVPLSAMGVMLGLLYRQTHSVWPCILIHALLNGFSMLMLGLMLLLKQAAG